MGGDGRGAEQLVQQAVVAVLHRHPALRGDHAPLRLEDLGPEADAPHPVGFHGHHFRQSAGREPVGVGGDVLAGERVVAAAQPLHPAVEFAGADRGGAVEHHVLDEMGHAGQAGSLVAGADPEEGVVGDVGNRGVAHQQDLEAVVEAMLLHVRRAEGSGGRQRGRDQDQAKDQGSDVPHDSPRSRVESRLL